MTYQVKQETTGNRRWFVNGKVVSRYRMYDWLQDRGLRPGQLTRQLVSEYVSWAQARGWKWEA